MLVVGSFQKMQPSEIFIHDSTILKVIENIEDCSINFIIDFPSDWENNVFEKKILRFENYLNYFVKEIPFSPPIQILDFIDFGDTAYKIGEIEIVRRKIELNTNAGKRGLEYENLTLIDFDDMFLK